MPRYFFATAEDLLPVFAAVESRHDLSYTLTGLHFSRVLVRAQTGASLPSLHAPAPCKNSVSGPAYLIMSVGAAVQIRTISQRSGGVRYAVDQLINPDSVVINHGGLFGNNVLLSGQIGTVWDTAFAKRIYRAFASAISQQFTRTGFYYVGTEARNLLKQGYRLTACADSPSEYDLHT